MSYSILREFCSKGHALTEENRYFWKGTSKKNGQWLCKQCLRDYSKSPKAKRQHMDSALRRRYGITLEEKEVMFKQQDGRCLIGGELFASFTKAHVDHDHKTGKVRGLLCAKCNQFLGHLECNPGLTTSAISYLEAHQVW